MLGHYPTGGDALQSRDQAIELIRARISIREVVSRYVALKPSGKGKWKGLCPFHQEKTPSFHVDEDKGFSYCFGCKNGGDIFGFLQKIEGIGFTEALERLASETGVELPEAKTQGKKRELYDVLSLSQEFFVAQLNPESTGYLQKRGLSSVSVQGFGLGYAPTGWDNLIKFLSTKGVSPEEGLQAGVLMEKDGRYFDRFRGRITFPILDPLGRVVAFTARALRTDDQPKYLNSPETSLFRKNQLLYGYPQARNALRQKSRAIVVEGLFDAIALHQLGFTETVAVLGAGLSAEQGLLLKRADVSELYLAFDADDAGLKATLQSLDLEVARSFLVSAVRLEGGKDPGDLLLQNDGAQRFEGFLGNALPEVEFRFQMACQNHNLESPEGKRKVLEALVPRLLSPDPLDRVSEALKAVVCNRLAIERRTLEDYLRSRATKAPNRKAAPNPQTAFGLSRPDLTEKRLLRELDIIALLFSVAEEDFLGWCQYVEDHTWPPEGSLLADFMAAARSESGKSRVLKHFEQRGDGARLFDVLMKTPQIPTDQLEGSLNTSMARLRETYYELRLDKLKSDLKAQPSTELLREIQETQRAIEAERRVYKR